LSIVERGVKVRSQQYKAVSAANLKPILLEQIDSDSRLMTDEEGQYIPIGKDFAEYIAL
jgi:hypothetical protein